MVSVERTFTVRTPMSAVVAYLRDFGHTESWDPGTVMCDQVGDDDPHVGTTWHNTSKFLGMTTELDYEMRRDDDDHLTFVGRNTTATSTDDLRFVDEDGSTRITYRATIQFHGLARLGGPIVQPMFQRIADKTVVQMTGVLEGLPR